LNIEFDTGDVVVTTRRTRVCVERFNRAGNPMRWRMSAAEARQLADALHDAADKIEQEIPQ
jgi:hypothetical protein